MSSEIPVTPVKKVYSNSNSNHMTSRITPAQKERMVRFMEDHPNLVYGKANKRYPNGEFTGLWRELTDILNSGSGNVTKNPEKWRKTWSDMKRDVKEKVARILEQRKQSAPPSGLEERLTPLQERLLALITRMEEAPEDETPPEIDLLGSETDTSKSGHLDDHQGSEINVSREGSEVLLNLKDWTPTELLVNTIKQELFEPVRESIPTSQDQILPPSPPTKRSRTFSPAETITTSSPEQAGGGSSEKLCTQQCTYKAIADHQAAAASALNRLADAAERRVAIEERKVIAMERFVELFFKQQQTNN